MKNIVLDSNIYISAFVFNATALKVLEKAMDHFSICTSEHLQAEVFRVLHEKFHFFADPKNREDMIFVETNLYNPKTYPLACRDPNDNFLLALAESCHAICIISGDKDLLDMNQWGKIPIVSPQKFLEM